MPPKGYLEQGVVQLFAKIVIGAAGAVTSSTGKGVTSIVKTAAKTGRYTLTLNDRYTGSAVLHSSVGLTGKADAAPGNGAAVAGYIRNDSTGAAAKTVDVQLYFSNGTANVDADADSGSVVTVHLVLKDSTV